MRGRGPGLGAPQVGGAELGRGGAAGEHGRDPGAGHDRAGRDERDVDGGADQLQRGEQGEVGGGLVVVEDAAVAAGLDALDDQGVGSARDGLARLLGRGDGEPDLGAGGVQARRRRAGAAGRR